MTVVITGATKGMGRAIAEIFAEAGHTIIACARSEKDLQQMKNDFFGRFPNVSVHTKTADIGSAGQVKDFGKWINDSGFITDILVNNAGYYVAGSIYNEEDDTFEKMLQINLAAAYHLTRALLPRMMQNKRGHIFNICSLASFSAKANFGSYGISKFALLGFTKNLREEMKPFGIKVTAVCPGATYTASWEGSTIGNNRIMEANDVAKMVLASSLLSPMAVVEDIIMSPQLGDL